MYFLRNTQMHARKQKHSNTAYAIPNTLLCHYRPKIDYYKKYIEKIS